MHCTKCGRPISSRMHGMCMKCRYKNKHSAPSIQKKIKPTKLAKCPLCGKIFIQGHGKIYCTRECGVRADNARKKAGRRSAMPAEPKKCVSCGAEFIPESKRIKRCPKCRQAKPSHGTASYCVECGEPFQQGTVGNKAKCPACSEKMKPKGRVGVKRRETPTRTTYLQPGGWTGEIEREPAMRKPAKARIRIPASKLPQCGKPTRNYADEQKTEEEKRKAIAQAEISKSTGMW